MLMAMALNKSIDDLKLLNPPRKLEDFNYHDKEMADIFNYKVRHTEFTGFSISGYILINSWLLQGRFRDQHEILKWLPFIKNG